MAPILIIEDDAKHGRELAQACENRGLPHLVINGDDIDNGSVSELERILDAHLPWAVIDAAGNPDLLTELCERRVLPFASYSPHAPDPSATLDVLLDESCRMADCPEQSTAVA